MCVCWGGRAGLTLHTGGSGDETLDSESVICEFESQFEYFAFYLPPLLPSLSLPPLHSLWSKEEDSVSSPSH